MTPQISKNKNSLNLFLNNYFNLFLAVFLILFLLAAYFLILAPKYQATLTAIKDEIAAKQNLYNIQKKKLADLKMTVSLYKKINPADLKKINDVFSDAYVKESLFGEIEDIVNQNGFTVTDIAITRPEDDVNAAKAAATSTPLNKNLGEIDINLSLGMLDYAGFKNLVKIFETNLRLMDISQINFSASDGTANLMLRTYYYKKS